MGRMASSQEVFVISRVVWGRVRRFSNPTSRVGSGRVGSGRVGSGRVPRPGSRDVTRFLKNARKDDKKIDEYSIGSMKCRGMLGSGAAFLMPDSSASSCTTRAWHGVLYAARSNCSLW